MHLPDDGVETNPAAPGLPSSDPLAADTAVVSRQAARPQTPVADVPAEQPAAPPVQPASPPAGSQQAPKPSPEPDKAKASTRAGRRKSKASNRELSTYKYLVRTAHDVELGGRIRAFSEANARELIAQPGSTVVKLKKASDFFSFEVGGRKVTAGELAIFTRQLAAFVRAGVPMVSALGSIGGEHSSRAMQDTLRLVAADLAEGVGLSEALALHPKVFPPNYLDLVRAGELTGQLDQVLDKAADYLTRQEEARRRVRGALAYPMVIALVAMATAVAMIGFVMPRFVTFFENFDAELPLPTRILINTTDFVRENFLFLFLGLVLIVGLGVLFVRTPRGRAMVDRLVLRMPAVGDVVRYSIIERFCHTLATMVSSGVPLARTFGVVAKGTNNVVYYKALSRVQESMLVGDGMSGPIPATGLFPQIVPQMMKVGEETGTLDEQLSIAADFFADELDFRLKRFTAIFEPLVIVGVALLVGFIALALVSAMYGIYEQIQ